jgi:hypothetical protein
MELFVIAIVAAVTIAAFWFAARRAVTIAELAIEDGAIRVVRGGLAPGVLEDLRDVAHHAGLDGVRVRIVRATRHATVEIKGRVEDGQAQRIRNVIGGVPLSRLAPAKRT